MGPDNKLKEAANDGAGWYDGDLSKLGIDTSPDSKVLFASTDASGNIVLAFVSPDKTLSEARYDGSWRVGAYGSLKAGAS